MSLVTVSVVMSAFVVKMISTTALTPIFDFDQTALFSSGLERKTTLNDDYTLQLLSAICCKSKDNGSR